MRVLVSELGGRRAVGGEGDEDGRQSGEGRGGRDGPAGNLSWLASSSSGLCRSVTRDILTASGRQATRCRRRVEVNLLVDRLRTPLVLHSCAVPATTDGPARSAKLARARSAPSLRAEHPPLPSTSSALPWTTRCALRFAQSPRQCLTQALASPSASGAHVAEAAESSRLCGRC